MGIELLPSLIRERYEVHEWKHACAILANDFPAEWQDIIDLLNHFKLFKSWLVVGGGSKSEIAKAIDSFLFEREWVEKEFETSVTVDETTMESPTHKVDCYRNGVALEIEWNNKDPFFDRDLNNFRLLFDLRAISVGIIITRCDELQDIFVELNQSEKHVGWGYGRNTRDEKDYFQHFSDKLINALKDYNVSVCMGTDCHTGDNIGNLTKVAAFILINNLQCHDLVK